MNATHYPQSAKSAFRSVGFLGTVGFHLSNVELIENTEKRKVYRAYTEEKKCYELVKAKVDGKTIYYMDDVTDPSSQLRVHPAAEHGILISIIDYNEKILKGELV